jgi:large subunit ribosomal protein L25
VNEELVVPEIRLPAEERTAFGKGGARRIRRAGLVPAVIYGHGAEPRHVSLPAREFGNALRHGGANVLLTLDVDGGEQLAIPKAVQRHPLKGNFEHVDLLAVRRGEKVTIEVPLAIVGEIVIGGLLTQEHTSVSIEAEATHLPSEIEVDIAGLPVGSHITAGELALPVGSVLVDEPDQVVVIIQEAPTAEELEGEVEEAAAEPAAAAGAPTGEGAPAPAE